MRTLIFPDTHQKIQKLDRILQNNTFDELVSLGDMFDDFYDTPAHSIKTAEYIQQLYSLYGERFTWILGNHDIPYMYPNMYDFYACSGTTREKMRAINSVFKHNMGFSPVLCKTIKVEGCFDVVISHAGAHESRFGQPFTDENISSALIETECNKALEMLKNLQPSGVLAAGRARGGRASAGGITWLDWNHEFEPIKGISQLLGHTPVPVPVVVDEFSSTVHPDEALPSMKRYILKTGKSYNINLDTHLEHYITIEDNELNIHEASVLFH